jgi:hypothetical protein
MAEIESLRSPIPLMPVVRERKDPRQQKRDPNDHASNPEPKHRNPDDDGKPNVDEYA